MKRILFTGSLVAAGLHTKKPKEVPHRNYGAYSIDELLTLNGLKDRVKIPWYHKITP